MSRSEMTSKERLKAALRGDPVDRIPWSPFLVWWWENQNEIVQAMGQPGFLRHLGADALLRGFASICKSSPIYAVMHTDAYDYSLPFGFAASLMEGDELTIISWGETIHRCVEASQGFSGRVTILDLRTIIPWDQERILDSVHKTGKVLIVHEDTITSGFGAEISAVIAAEAFTALDAPIRRLATPDIPVPYNVQLMKAVIPSVDKIRLEISELLDF